MNGNQQRAAWRRHKRAWRARRFGPRPAPTSAIGVQRRLQALAALGWSYDALAARLGCSKQNVHQLATTPHLRVYGPTAARVVELYDQLSMTVGPSLRTRARALANGWTPPLSWNDDELDDPAAAPDCGAFVPRQQALAEDSEELLGQGFTLTQVAWRLGVSRRYLENVRYREGLLMNERMGS